MAKLDLTQYGITGSTVIAHNPSYEYLFEEAKGVNLDAESDAGVKADVYGYELQYNTISATTTLSFVLKRPASSGLSKVFSVISL